MTAVAVVMRQTAPGDKSQIAAMVKKQSRRGEGPAGRLAGS
jgi:hypothetical protein